MKGILVILSVALVWLPVCDSKAELLDDEDDSYIGLQITIPLAKRPAKLSQADFEYSLLLIDKSDGITTGFTWTRDRFDNQTLGYLPPSNQFLIGERQR